MVGRGTDQAMIGIAVAVAVVGFVAIAIAIAAVAAVGNVCSVGIVKGPTTLRGSALFVSGFLLGTATHGQRSSVSVV